MLQDGGVVPSISIGIGVAAPGTGKDRDALMLEADKALYEAKWAGRDCFRRMNLNIG
jgi:GGDEF domain-containing protein